ncbi:MAG: peptide deformylase [Dehalococcoidia bacterium]|nr:peptide deformylase [Dehalococcoidia bacterium]
MAVLPLKIAPAPVLRQKAKRVKVIDASIRRLAEDMVDTMRHHQGAGLAANQVGVLKRVITIEVPEEPVRVLINPEIIKREGEREVEEGCLSIPEYRGLVTRAIWVRAKALELGGTEVRIRAEGILAQALEHEIDHLNGILYIDHLKSHEDLWKLEPEEASQEEAAPDSEEPVEAPQPEAAAIR